MSWRRGSRRPCGRRPMLRAYLSLGYVDVRVRTERVCAACVLFVRVLTRSVLPPAFCLIFPDAAGLLRRGACTPAEAHALTSSPIQLPGPRGPLGPTAIDWR